MCIRDRGNAVTYCNGTLLAVESWSTGGSFPCLIPQDAAWISLNTGPGGGMVVDNLCIGSPFATNYCPANPNSTGGISIISAIGSPSISANDMLLSTTNLPSLSFGLYVVSMTQGFLMNPGGSTGNLCLGGVIGRYLPGMNSGSSGSITLALDWTLGIPQGSSLVPAVLGDTWNFQLFHRDFVGGSATTNFSEGLSVTLAP